MRSGGQVTQAMDWLAQPIADDFWGKVG
jgi:hypothetical protein